MAVIVQNVFFTEGPTVAIVELRVDLERERPLCDLLLNWSGSGTGSGTAMGSERCYPVHSHEHRWLLSYRT